VKHHVECQLRLRQAEDGLKENKMPGAADGKKFRQPLHHPKKDRLKNVDAAPPKI
jgi:hypothetical protein